MATTKRTPTPTSAKPAADEQIAAALAMLKADIRAEATAQRRKPKAATAKIKPAIAGRRNPTARDIVAGLAGVSHARARMALEVVRHAPAFVVKQVQAGKLALREAHAKLVAE